MRTSNLFYTPPIFDDFQSHLTDPFTASPQGIFKSHHHWLSSLADLPHAQSKSNPWHASSMTLHSRERYNCRRKALCVAACIYCLAQHMLLGLEFAKHKLRCYLYWHAFSFAIPKGAKGKPIFILKDVILSGSY